MKRKKLQLLISAGAFSAALMAGAVYAADKDKDGDTDQVQVSTGTPDTTDQGSQGGQAPAAGAKQKKSAKSGSDMGCSSANGCGNH